MATIAYTDKVDQPAKADYEIFVEFKKVSEYDYEVVVPHMPTNPPLYLGKTVHYTSKAGVVTIKFPENGSPYDKTEVSSNDPPLELKREGHFMGSCYITFGYEKDPHIPGYTHGANHDVQKPPNG
jgi:hypothetical protein